MNSTQLTLIGYLASGKPAVLVKPKGWIVTCNGNLAFLPTLESLVRKGVAELVPGTTNQWRLSENGRKWFLPDFSQDQSLESAPIHAAARSIRSSS